MMIEDHELLTHQSLSSPFASPLPQPLPCVCYTEPVWVTLTVTDASGRTGQETPPESSQPGLNLLTGSLSKACTG